jgi:hypothetical protein
MIPPREQAGATVKSWYINGEPSDRVALGWPIT